MHLRRALSYKAKQNWLGVSVATAALIAGAALPGAARPPVSNSGIAGTAQGGDGGGGLGPAKPWLASLGGINTATGNLFTPVSLFGWQAKGGMSVGFGFFHNSHTDPNDLSPHFAPKWSFSYNSYITELANGNVRLCEEDGSVSTLVKNSDGTYKNPPGIYLLKLEVVRTPNQPRFILKTRSGTTLSFSDTVTDPSGARVYLNEVRDRNGYLIQILRNPANAYEVTRVTEVSTNRSLDVTWTSGRITSVQAPSGKTWAISYDGSLISQVTLPLNPELTPASTSIGIGYNVRGNISSLRDPRGIIAQQFRYEDNFDYDAVTHITDAVGNLLTLGYDDSDGRVTITDANQHAVKHFYLNSRLKSIQDANNQSVFFDEYDVNNNAKKITDRRNNITRFTFDPSFGDVLSVLDAENKPSSFTYNAFGDVKTTTNALNQTTTYDYDTAGNLTSVSDPLNHGTIFTVVQGLVTKITNALGHETIIGYDPYGYPNLFRDPNGVETRAEFNVMGSKIKEWDAQNLRTDFTLDTWDRAIGVHTFSDGSVPGLSTWIRLDPNGNTTWMRRDNGGGRGPASIVSTFEYDNNNRLKKATNARGYVSEWSYDGPGQKGLLSWSQNGRGAISRRTYIYNNRDLPYYVYHPDGDSEAYDYDANGNVTAYKNGDDIVNSYEYDKRNLLIRVNHPQGYGPQISTGFFFSRDALGRVDYMTDSTGRTDFTFDAAGRQTSLVSPRGTVAYQYDNANNLILKTLQGVGSWQYFNNNSQHKGRVYYMVNPYGEGTSIHYDGTGRVDFTISGNNISTGYGYDSMGRLRDLQHFKSNTPVAFSSYSYEYDGFGRLDRSFHGGTRMLYEYDNTDQLTRDWLSNPDGSNTRYDTAYTYDENGNRKTKTTNGVLEINTYTPGDRLSRVDGYGFYREYLYNRNGFLTQVKLNGQFHDGISSDLEGRVLSHTDASGLVTSFQYNALGQRVFKQDYSGPYNYVTDGASAGSPVLSDGRAVYTQGLSERRNGVSRFHQTDMLGSLGDLTDASQTQTDGGTFDAFGVPTGRFGGTLTPFEWGGAGGYQRDFTTGLTLMGNRYYDAQIGRFLSRDPARSGSNWYAYADNNPVTNLDPLGLSVEHGGNIVTSTATTVIGLGVIAWQALGGGGGKKESKPKPRKSSATGMSWMYKPPTGTLNLPFRPNGVDTLEVNARSLQRGIGNWDSANWRISRMIRLGIFFAPGSMGGLHDYKIWPGTAAQRANARRYGNMEFGYIMRDQGFSLDESYYYAGLAEYYDGGRRAPEDGTPSTGFPYGESLTTLKDIRLGWWVRDRE